MNDTNHSTIKKHIKLTVKYSTLLKTSDFSWLKLLHQPEKKIYLCEIQPV